MIPQLQNLLQLHSTDSSGVYGNLSGFSTDQFAEIELRQRVTAEHYGNYLDAISRSHSMQVIDREVVVFWPRCRKVL